MKTGTAGHMVRRSSWIVLLVLAGLVILGCQRRMAPAPMAPPPAPSTTYQYEAQYVTAYRLNVRSGPGTNHRIIAVLKRGEAVQILQRSGNWFLVQRPLEMQAQSGFSQGWVYGGYLTGYQNEIPTTQGVKPQGTQQQQWNVPARQEQPSGFGDAAG